MKQHASDRMDLQRGAIRFFAAANEWFSRCFHELALLSPSSLPAAGPAILVCNHTAGIDPLLVQSACPRLVVWMMAREYYELRALKSLFGMISAIPVDRDGRDMSATRSALRALKGGRILGIFPEGKIETERELLPFQTGVALLAIKSKAPVFSAYLDGTQRGREMLPSVLRRCHATLAFGGEVHFDRENTSREGLETATAAIRAEVQRLKNLTEGLRV